MKGLTALAFQIGLWCSVGCDLNTKDLLHEAVIDLDGDHTQVLPHKSVVDLDGDHTQVLPHKSVVDLDGDLNQELPHRAAISLGGGHTLRLSHGAVIDLGLDDAQDLPHKAVIDQDGYHTQNLPHTAVKNLDGDHTQDLPHKADIDLDGDHTQDLPHKADIDLDRDHTQVLPHKAAMDLDGDHTQDLPHKVAMDLDGDHTQDLPHKVAMDLDGDHTQGVPHKVAMDLDGDHTKDLPHRPAIDLDRDHTQGLPHTAVMDLDGEYLLSWDFDDEQILFEVQVKTLGYVGFGLSPRGKMVGADLVMGGIDSIGQAYFSDRHAVGQTEPLVDSSTDWFYVWGKENATHTVLRFRRSLETCDPQDLPITADTIRVVWSYGRADPDKDGRADYHVKRGTKSMALLSHHRQESVPPQDSFTLDFINPQIPPRRIHGGSSEDVDLVDIPSYPTTYWCQAFRVPVTGKHHIIKFEPIIQSGHQSLVHHIIIYGCFNQSNLTSVGGGHFCYHDNMPGEWWGCVAVMFAWAIGGGAFHFPDHVGYPMGFEGDPDMMLMETHYDNPQQLSGLVDSSGLRLTMTRVLREHDAGVISMGTWVRPTQIIPPFESDFVTHGHCHKDCIAQALQNRPQGIRVFAGVLHSHLLGAAIEIRHFRAGKELSNLLRDENYDFNLQETRLLREEVTVLPGDHFITECHYDSSTRLQLTFGGLSTTDEMCLGFALYYPRIPLTNCESTHLPQTLHLFLREIFGDDAVSQGDTFWLNTTLWNTIDWSNPATRAKFQEFTTDPRYPLFVQCHQGQATQYQVHRTVREPSAVREPLVTRDTCDELSQRPYV